MTGCERVVREFRGDLPSVRCECCNRLLFRGVVETIEIKCPKCGAVQVLNRGDQSWLKPYGLPKNRRQQNPGVGIARREVTDSAGRLVAVPGRPERVIALNASNLGLYYATGGKVVGRASTEMLPPDIREMVKNIPTVGMPPNPDRERIMAMNPDLVLGMHVPMHLALAAVLEKAGIPVLLQALTHYTDVLETLRLYGELSGNPAQAAGKIQAIENRRKAVLNQHAGQPSPRVLIIWGIADGLYTALSNSFVGDLVKRLGGVNVADVAAPIDANLSYAPVAPEMITGFEPDVILLISHSFHAAGCDRFRAELNGPAWQSMRAVQQNHVYQLPYQLFAVNPGPQLEEAITVLADYMYRGSH